MVAGDLGENAMPLEQRDDDHLREQPVAGGLQHVPAGAQLHRLRLAEFDADHEPAASHVGEQLVAAGQRL